MQNLFTYPIAALRGVGPKRAPLFEKLGAPTAGDLLRLYPRTYEDWSNPLPLRETLVGDINVVKGTVLVRPTEHRIRGGMLLYKTTITDGESDLHLTFFNNKYIPNLLLEGQSYFFRGKITGTPFTREMASPEFYSAQKTLPILPVYPQTAGLSSRQILNVVTQALQLLPDTSFDPLPPEIRAKYQLCHLNFALESIHTPQNQEAVEIARRRLIFEELLVLQLGLRRMRQRNRVQNCHVLTQDHQAAFAALLPFSLTMAQTRAIAESTADLCHTSTMNRLLQGDVGSGKTAVAAALCHAVACEGKQAAMMAPTEILARQHFHSLTTLLAPAGISVDLLTGSLTAKQKRLAYARLAMGETQILVGTHALISEAVVFQNLALVITDEQHRFGVAQRSALAKKGRSPHFLVMSATPIPRTLALMIYGDLDISVLDELPPGRQKIETYCITSEKRQRAFGYIQKHLAEGRQGYIICPLVDEGENDLASVTAYATFLKDFFPPEDFAVLHGKMKPREKDRVMEDFSSGKTRILISTTVVEVGVDVPNAVIMLIENAERYGLSQLHQLRGRIGRGQHRSTCILLTDAQNEEAISRMKVMCATTDGFKIADHDLRLRGPGDFFGARQHGLPQLKIADMMKDMSTLREAQACATTLLAEDPHLTAHPLLLQETRRLFVLSGNAQRMVL